MIAGQKQMSVRSGLPVSIASEGNHCQSLLDKSSALKYGTTSIICLVPERYAETEQSKIEFIQLDVSKEITYTPGIRNPGDHKRNRSLVN